MNNKMPQPPQPSAAAKARKGRANPVWMLLLVLGTLAGSGCFRATGIQRNAMAAEVIPESGGDRVPGLKAKGGAGDLYLGNDFVQIVLDGAVPANPATPPLAGALGGGSIIDAGVLQLDASFARVSPPANAMHRLTPVVNQDPGLQMRFDSILPGNEDGLARVTMTGVLLDPDNALGTGASPVAGVTVEHRITVAQLERYFTLTTTLTNNSGAALPIRSLGDCLVQEGGGYRFAVPASHTFQGDLLPLDPAAVTDPWGVQIPQTDFAHPLENSVQAAMVALMDTEPGADTLDCHASLGILPVDDDRLLVAADAQDLLAVDAAHLRPAFPGRLVAGSLPAAPTLASGASLTYRRRLYILGGQSVAANTPGQATGLFNAMETDRHIGNALEPALRLHDTGLLTFNLSGTSVRQGPRPTEVRLERQVGTDSLGQPVWQLERVEWFEPNENLVSAAALAPSTLQVILPVGIYRMVLRTQDLVQVRDSFDNLAIATGSNGQPWLNLAGPLWIQKGLEFVVNPLDVLCPDATQGQPNLVGAIANNPYSAHYFATRELNGIGGSLQPLRITLAGLNGTADPVLRRQRTLASYFDPESKGTLVATPSIAGQSQYRGGNELFGTGFTRLLPAEFVWLRNPSGPAGSADYRAYGSRGPLSGLATLDLAAFDGQTQTGHELIVVPMGLPPGWTSFDLPGPSQATTGGYLPGEKLTSAMAEGVQVVGATEQDRQVDAAALYSNFLAELGHTDLVSAAQRPASLSAITRPAGFPYGVDPFVVGARSSALAGYGSVSALFTPAPTGARMGGTPSSAGWVLADFLAQAQGQYNVIHRPRDPQAGLFTLKGAPAGAAWMQERGLFSFNTVNGGFDALELLRGEGLDPAQPEAWFSEFLAVRADWFGLLNTQTPAAFTKALGLSSARFSLDTPVGLARTYLKASPTVESDLSGVLAALRKGAAVASTGPFLDVGIGASGPGDLVVSPVRTLTLNVNLWKSDWMPVRELRVVVNGVATAYDLVANPALLTPSASDPRLFTGTFQVDLTGITTDAWVVVEAGVSIASPPAAGPYADPAIDLLEGAGFVARWNQIMRGIYPIAVTNPIFVSVTGSASYIPPATVAAAVQ